MRKIDAQLQYEALGAWVYRAAQRNRPLQPTDLAIHKPLRPPPDHASDRPHAGATGLDRWLAERIRRHDPTQIVDLGCGFGSTLCTLAESTQAELTGIAASVFQIEQARQLAHDRGLAERLRFIQEPLETVTLSPQPDAGLSIEAIGYVADVLALAERLHTQMQPGGHLHLVDDWLKQRLPPTDADYGRFLACWGRTHVPLREEFIAHFEWAGFRLVESVDLTDQVDAGRRSHALRRTSLRLAVALAPTRRWQALLAAFLGGCYLEALYARGLTAYSYLHFQNAPR